MKTLLIGGDITPAAELLREGGLVAVLPFRPRRYTALPATVWTLP